MTSISLCMIVKNEERILGRCLDSVKDIVDEIIICDTGSTDKTVEIAESYNAKVVPFTWVDDFSAARKESFAHATKDWILWLDADDVLPKAQELKAHLEEVVANDPEVGCIMLPYLYAFDDSGNPTCTLTRERLLRNNRQWEWRDPIHEYIAVTDTKIYQFEDTPVHHLRDSSSGSRTPTRNLVILERMLAEQGPASLEPRHWVYLGDERRSNGNIPGAIEAYEQYLKVSTWVEEIYQVLVKLSRLCVLKGDVRLAAKYAFQAEANLPDWPDAYICLAEVMLARAEWEKALAFAHMALTHDSPKTLLILFPLDYQVLPHIIKAQAFEQLSKIPEALSSAERVLSIIPNHPDMLALTERCTRDVEKDMIISSVKLTAEVSHNPLQIYHSLSDTVKSIPEVQDIAAPYVKEAPQSPSIAIYTGPHFEPWGPDTINTSGIGGSETAVIYMAENLSIEGITVEVYGEPGSQMGKRVARPHARPAYWLPARHFDPSVYRDVVVSSRIPELFNNNVNAGEKWLWLHDISVGDRITPEIVEKVDKFLVLSEHQMFQYKALYNIPEEKFYRIRNGINEDKIASALAGLVGVEKDPYRFIWSSSPDRGLEYLLMMFPTIKSLYPEATLHIYYGWDNYEKFAQNNPQMLYFMEKIKVLVDQPGVTWEGRVPQDKLYQEMFKSGIWMYPSTFRETYCITALEMLACGVLPIVSEVGALPETLASCGYLIEGSPEYPEVQEEFIHTLNAVYGDSAEDARRKTQLGATYAFTTTWGGLADEWAQKIRRIADGRKNSR